MQGRLVTILGSIFVCCSIASGAAVSPIRLCVRTPQQEGGFAEPGADDSVRDIRNAILSRDRKLVELVDECGQADVIVEVLKRGKEMHGGETAVGVPIGGHTIVTSSPDKNPTVYTRLVVGAYTRDIMGTSEWNWSGAAKDATKQIVNWIKENQDKLRANRKQ